jgi:DNA processing protein
MDNQKIFLAALVSFIFFGPKRIALLEGYFSSFEKAYFANESQLVKSGIGEKLAGDFCAWRKEFDFEKMKEILIKEKIELVAKSDENYPSLLLATYDPPPLLFCKGVLKKEELFLAVVGSRKSTVYGERIIKEFIPPLVGAGVGIASGLALGIDALAHAATLKSGGRTIAVLGSGVDKDSIYPRQNYRLSEEIIASGGAVISEFAPGGEPLKANFPRRNRIISGLSVGTLVVEAAEKSGSLITARYALDEGREVMAVPGGIFSWQSGGPNRLIKEGARVILSVTDIMEGLKIDACKVEKKKKDQEMLGLDENEKNILTNLSSEPVGIDDLSQKCQLDIKIINSTLTILEIKGLVKNSGGGTYVLF